MPAPLTPPPGDATRDKFAALFGENNAVAVEAAAESHENGINSERKGSDPFKWALAICIGYECMSKDSYREHHGITAPWADIDKWMVENTILRDHDGDCDYLALFSGAYNRYAGVPEIGESKA